MRELTKLEKEEVNKQIAEKVARLMEAYDELTTLYMAVGMMKGMTVDNMESRHKEAVKMIVEVNQRIATTMMELEESGEENEKD